MSEDHSTGWRKRQIALDIKAENARHLGLDYEPNKTIMEMARVAGVRDDGHRFEFSEYKYLERFAALVREEALAQPEQEPVAWMTINEYGDEDDIHYENPEGHLLDGWTYKPLYTHPPQPAPVQEPVAWMEMVTANLVREGINKHKARELAEHFYTTPPAAQRPWVGLTDDEINAIDFPESGTATIRDFVRIIEAKLKQKNT